MEFLGPEDGGRKFLQNVRTNFKIYTRSESFKFYVVDTTLGYFGLYYKSGLHDGLTRVVVLYRVSQEERTKLREGVPYVKLYRYNPKHLCPKLNGFQDNGK